MNAIARFLRYAGAFEEAYASDDWSKLDPYFTADAVYHPLAAFGGPITGREALKAAFKAMVDNFDRRFASRAVEVLEGPAERAGAVWFRWAATYTLPDAPALRMLGEETVEFDGDRIRRLEDRMTDDGVRQVQEYLAKYGSKLAVS